MMPGKLMRLWVLFVSMWVAPVATAAPDIGALGAGLMVGEPSGLSFKLFVDGRHAFDGGLSFSLKDETFHGHADYLLHFSAHGGSLEGGKWVPYVGVGAKLQFLDQDRKHSNDGLAARIPLGVVFHPRTYPLDFFVELIPGMTILPETDPEFGGALGGRFYF